MFGDECVNFKDNKNLSVTVDGVTASIDPETRVSVAWWAEPESELAVTSDLCVCVCCSR